MVLVRALRRGDKGPTKKAEMWYQQRTAAVEVSCVLMAVRPLMQQSYAMRLFQITYRAGGNYHDARNTHLLLYCTYVYLYKYSVWDDSRHEPYGTYHMIAAGVPSLYDTPLIHAKNESCGALTPSFQGMRHARACGIIPALESVGRE